MESECWIFLITSFLKSLLKTFYTNICIISCNGLNTKWYYSWPQTSDTHVPSLRREMTVCFSPMSMLVANLSSPSDSWSSYLPLPLIVMLRYCWQILHFCLACNRLLPFHLISPHYFQSRCFQTPYLQTDLTRHFHNYCRGLIGTKIIDQPCTLTITARIKHKIP